KCPRCSLVGICLPDETEAIDAAARGEASPQQLSLFPEELRDDAVRVIDDAMEQPVRRLVPARDDLRPLYVPWNGLTIGRSSEVLKIRERGKAVPEVRLNAISQVSVFGHSQLTSAAMHGLCRLERPIAQFSFGGWSYGLTEGVGLENVFLRRDQFGRAEDGAFCLEVARSIV